MSARTTPRQPESIALDRQAILDYVRGQGVPVRPTAWMRRGDIDALVREGKLAREVRREWDSQGGYAGRSGMFGGAGVCMRRRAYLSMP